MSDLLLGFSEKDTAEADERARLNPLDPTAITPGTFDDFGKGAGTDFVRGVGTTYYMLGAPGALIEDVLGGTGTQARDQHFRSMEQFVDDWTPDARTTGMAGRVAGQFAAMTAPLLLTRNPSMASFATTTTAIAEPSMTLTREGVPASTVGLVAAEQGVANLVGMRIPALGSTLATRLAYGAGANVALDVPTQLASAEALDNAGFADLAEGYAPSIESTVLSAGIGFAFGGWEHARVPRPTRSQRDALLSANNASHFANDTLPGEPRTPEAAVAHQGALETAIRQVLNGERVNVADHLDLDGFTLRPELRGDDGGADYDGFRHALESGGDPNADAPTSGALGVDQFIPDTWRRVVARAAPAWAEGLDDAQLLELRRDPTKSAEMERVLRAENAAALDRAGQAVTSINLYASHHFGAGKGVAFAKASGDTPMSEILTAGQLKANPYLKGKTKDQAIANWTRRARKSGAMVSDNPDAPGFGLGDWPKTIPDADPFWQSIPEGANGRETANINTPERDSFRDQLVAEHFVDKAPAPEGRRPIAYVMGGGGASGKGTLLASLQESGDIPRGVVQIDPDAIKAGEHGITGIREYAAMLKRGDSRAAAIVHEESSQVAGRAKAQAIAEGRDFVLDRTLGNPDKAIVELQELAKTHEIRLFGVTIDPAEAIDRAVSRALKRKRYVPLKELLKAHKGFANGFERYAEIADQAHLFDNTVELQPLARGPRGALEILDESGYNHFRARRSTNEKASTHRELAHRSESDASPAGSAARPDQRRGATQGDRGPRSERADGLRSDHGKQELDPQQFPVQGNDATITPENRAAYEAIAAMPDLQVMGDDGVMRSAADFLAEGEAEAAQAADTARATEAAANCYLRTAA